jgi:hypothetical protein
MNAHRTRRMLDATSDLLRDRARESTVMLSVATDRHDASLALMARAHERMDQTLAVLQTRLHSSDLGVRPTE